MGRAEWGAWCPSTFMCSCSGQALGATVAGLLSAQSEGWEGHKGVVAGRGYDCGGAGFRLGYASVVCTLPRFACSPAPQLTLLLFWALLTRHAYPTCRVSVVDTRPLSVAERGWSPAAVEAPRSQRVANQSRRLEANNTSFARWAENGASAGTPAAQPAGQPSTPRAAPAAVEATPIQASAAAAAAGVAERDWAAQPAVMAQAAPVAATAAAAAAAAPVAEDRAPASAVAGEAAGSSPSEGSRRSKQGKKFKASFPGECLLKNAGVGMAPGLWEFCLSYACVGCFAVSGCMGTMLRGWFGASLPAPGQLPSRRQPTTAQPPPPARPQPLW